MSAPRTNPLTVERNPGVPLDLEWVEECRVNRSAAERRASSLGGRRTVKKEWQAAWLLRAIQCMDLTTLAGDDTAGTVLRLCAKAVRPVREEILDALGIRPTDLRTGAVCVYHDHVATAVRALEGTGIPVAAVAAGFPHGQSPLKEKLGEVRASVAAGATEIDIVITRAFVLNARWRDLYDEVQQCRDACGDAHLKVILATGELGTLTNVAKASAVSMMAGADFIKTSTGKETENAVLPVGLVMCRAIREYLARTGYRVGFKPAGGIRTARQSTDWLILMREELGPDWQQPELFRLGASTLLNDIERQLEHFLTGRYAARFKQPLG